MTPQRLALWAAALGVSAWSAWIVTHPAEPEELVVTPVVRRAPGPVATGAASAATAAGRLAGKADAADVAGAAEASHRRAPLAEQAGADPFHVAPPPPPPAAKAAKAAAVVVAPPPPPPPPPPPAPTLPYRFLGFLAERDGSDPRVFLMYGDRMIMARPGETLDGGWRLERIQPRELLFTRPADQLQLRLAIEEGLAS